VKVWLVSAQDWDGVNPESVHATLDSAKTAAELSQAAHLSDLRARGKSVVKGFKAQWVDHGDGWWEYGGWQIDEMEVQ
jgi:hypothetical protein